MEKVSTQKWDEAYDERAGVLEFQAGLSRQTAELAARELVTKELGPRPRRAVAARPTQEGRGEVGDYSL